MKYLIELKGEECTSTIENVIFEELGRECKCTCSNNDKDWEKVKIDAAIAIVAGYGANAQMDFGYEQLADMAIKQAEVLVKNLQTK